MGARERDYVCQNDYSFSYWLHTTGDTGFDTMNADELLSVMSARNQGTTKREFFSMCKLFDAYMTESTWKRFLYFNKKEYIPMFEFKDGKWYNFDDQPYFWRTISIMAIENRDTVNPCTGWTRPTSWMKEKIDLFCQVFKVEDFK